MAVEGKSAHLEAQARLERTCPVILKRPQPWLKRRELLIEAAAV